MDAENEKNMLAGVLIYLMYNNHIDNFTLNDDILTDLEKMNFYVAVKQLDDGNTSFTLKQGDYINDED